MTSSPDYSSLVSRALRFKPFQPLAVDGRRLAELLEATTVRPVSAWSWDCRPGWELHPRKLPESVWYCIEEGTGWCRLGADINSAPRARLAPGDIFLVPKGVQHQIKPDRGVVLRLHTVRFLAEIFGNVDALGGLGIGGLYHPERSSRFLSASSQLVREFALRAPGWIRAMQSNIWIVLLEIIREYGADFDTARADELLRLRPVLELARDRLGDPLLKIGQLAAAIEVSEVYLRTLFSKALGVSPVNFLRLRRIEQACMLLKSTRLSAAMVAARCGFNQMPFFYRTFRRYTGMTPGEYRESTEL